MNALTYSVPAISCDHCKMSIEGSVNKIDGVAKVDVNVDNKTVLVEGTATDTQIRAAIDKAGYDVVDA